MKWQAISLLTPDTIEHDYFEGTLRVAGGGKYRIMDNEKRALVHQFDMTIVGNYMPFLARLSPNARVRVIFEFDDEDQEDGGT